MIAIVQFVNLQELTEPSNCDADANEAIRACLQDATLCLSGVTINEDSQNTATRILASLTTTKPEEMASTISPSSEIQISAVFIQSTSVNQTRIVRNFCSNEYARLSD